MKISNSYVYNSIMELKVSTPDIPCFLPRMYSQCGEDLIVCSIIDSLVLTEKFDIKNSIFFEIGANNPIATSNSFLLEQKYGLTGVLVEANPSLVPDLIRARGRNKIINSAVVDYETECVDFYISNLSELSSVDSSFVDGWDNGFVGRKDVISVKAERINKILEENTFGKKISLLSIDVEGLDLKIIKDLDLNKWRPLIIQLEPSEHFIEDAKNKMISYMDNNGYLIVAATDVNLIFVDASIYLG